jgi:hypothetical protein
MDELLLVAIIYFGAKTADSNVDDIRIAVEIHVPELGGDKRPGQYFALAAQ